MAKLTRLIVAFDEALLDRVFQPVLVRLARVRDAPCASRSLPLERLSRNGI